MAKTVTIGDTVRLKSNGDLYDVEGKENREHVEFLILSRYGHLSGTIATGVQWLNRRDEVVLQRLQCEFVDDD
jgi:hypothetical protein